MFSIKTLNPIILIMDNNTLFFYYACYKEVSPFFKLYKEYITLASSKCFTIRQLFGGAGA